MTQTHTASKVLAGTVGALGLFVVSTQAANADTVTVKNNDTVWSLAKRYGVSVKSIEKANGIKQLDTETDLIFSGQKLTIGQKKSTPAKVTSPKVSKTATTGNTYTVKAGDSLWAIANDNGVSVSQLLAANGIQAGDVILPGQKLVLKGTAKAAVNKADNSVKSRATAKPVTSGSATVKTASQAPKATSQASSSSTSQSTSQTTATQTTSQSSAKTTTTSQTPQSQAKTSVSAASHSTQASQAQFRAHTVTKQAVSQNTATSASSTKTTSEAAKPAQSTATSQSQSQATSQAPQSQAKQSSASQAPQSAQSQAKTSQAAQSAQPQSQQQQTANSTSTPKPSAASTAPKPAQAASTAPQSATSQSAASQASSQATSQAPQSQAAQQNNQQSQANTQSQAKQPAQNTANLSSGSVTGLASSLAHANIPYVWGGSSLSGMDCSGFVAYVFQHAAGKSLPHSTTALEGVVSQHSVSAAQPGDLLFWGPKGSTYHVAIYLGNNTYAAAPQPGQNVDIETINGSFAPSFAGTVN